MADTGRKLLEEIRNTRPAKDSYAVWWLGQMGFVIKKGKTTILVDGYLAPNPARRVEPAFDPAEADIFTAVLGTHNHDDHIDIWAWQRLAKANPSTVFIGPAAHRKSVAERTGMNPNRYVGLDEDIAIQIGDIRVDAIPAAHEFIETDSEGQNLHLSYILDNCIFHSGDTCIYDGQKDNIREFDPLRAMILPINGRDGARYRRNCIGNMTFQEAVDLAGDLKPGVVIPGHYDMFEGNLGDPDAFCDYLNAKYPDVKALVPTRFEMFTL